MALRDRVVARFLRKADLSPPLGVPGGPCHVVDRIEKVVQSPRLRDHLTEEVEHNEDLANPEAAKVYHTETEHGSGPIQRIIIGPHAQYRMDLRGITVPDVRETLDAFGRYYEGLRAVGGSRFTNIERAVREPFAYRNRGLIVVFKLIDDSSVQIVTTYWSHGGTPKVAPGECT